MDVAVVHKGEIPTWARPITSNLTQHNKRKACRGWLYDQDILISIVSMTNDDIITLTIRLQLSTESGEFPKRIRLTLSNPDVNSQVNGSRNYRLCEHQDVFQTNHDNEVGENLTEIKRNREHFRSLLFTLLLTDHSISLK